MLNKKVENLQSILLERDVSAVMIAPSEEMNYIFGIYPHLCERFHGLVITKDKGCFDVCNILNRDEMIKGLGVDIPIYSWRDGDDFAINFNQACQDYGLIGQKIAIDQTVRAFNLLALQKAVDVEFVDGRDILGDLKIIKSEDEIKKLRLSAELADSVFEKVLSFVKPGVTEKEITTLMDKVMRDGGATDTFTLACAGANASYPHYNKDDGVIGKSDILLMDWGCNLNGYWSDISRTIFIGDATKEQRKAYEVVKKAQQNAIDKVQLGIEAGVIDAVARDYITESGYGEYFTTRLGHGIGSSVHEGPFMVANSSKKLRKNMCFTIEPGVYLTGNFGIRIEDSLTVDENGASLFNNVTKDMIII